MTHNVEMHAEKTCRRTNDEKKSSSDHVKRIRFVSDLKFASPV
jgi:hypothetical protein